MSEIANIDYIHWCIKGVVVQRALGRTASILAKNVNLFLVPLI